MGALMSIVAEMLALGEAVLIEISIDSCQTSDAETPEPDHPEYAKATPEICFTDGGDARDAGYMSNTR